jgi:hypothetical protein
VEPKPSGSFASVCLPSTQAFPPLDQGIAEGIEATCELLGIEITAERRAHMNGLDATACGAARGDPRPAPLAGGRATLNGC